MARTYICKDCNYTTESRGICPYCEMPLEPVDGVDEVTGEVHKYEQELIDEEMDDEKLDENISDNPLEYDELDEIIGKKSA